MDHAAPLAPWGKLDRADPSRRLSLVGHSIDVAAVARALLDLPTWKRRFDRLAGRTLTPLDVDRLTVLAYLHDTGKAGSGFYSKSLLPERQAAWLAPHGNRAQCGHTSVVAALLPGHPAFDHHRAAISLDVIRQWAGDEANGRQQMLNLWMAAVSHHGDPLAVEHLENPGAAALTWQRPVDGYDPLLGLRQLGNAARTLWHGAFVASESFGEPSQQLIHGFAGLVSLADWIGSNCEPDFFPYDLGETQDASRWHVALPRAREVLRRMRIDVEDIRADLRRRSPDFFSVFGFEPTEMQRVACDPSRSSPVVLEAETGSGKTEAALWRFKTLFELGEVDALCFLLPTKVAATGIAERVDDFVAKLFPDPALRPNTVLAVPSYLRANAEDGRRLPQFKVLWADRGAGDPMFWAAENSKRYFAAAAATATIDQFLLSTLQVKHAHLRATTLLRSLVVVDEVHASDRYMRVLLTRALERHVGAGGNGLLLSATLTSDMRGALLDVADRTRRLRKSDSEQPAAEEKDYPRLSSPGQPPFIGAITWNKRIHHELAPWMRDADAVARCAREAVAQGAKVLILRNTVRQAVATQRAIEAQLGADHPALFRCNGIVVLHHGRYALPDRQALDARVGDCFGTRAAELQQPMVLCATQTVEISVDCDADFMITDLAPMDVLLQRLGRLHRHRKRDDYRPASHQAARCVILTPPTDFEQLLAGAAARGLGIGPRSAYTDLLCLKATLLALQDPTFSTLCIPQHNRVLVERTCGTSALQALANSLGSVWKKHLAEQAGIRSAQGGQALYNCIDWQKYWSDAVAGDLSADQRTRLGLDGIDVSLPGTGAASPLGHRLERLTIPAWMLPGVGESEALPCIEDLRTDHTGLTFSLRGQPFAYDRFGLAKL